MVAANPALNVARKFEPIAANEKLESVIGRKVDQFNACFEGVLK